MHPPTPPPICTAEGVCSLYLSSLQVHVVHSTVKSGGLTVESAQVGGRKCTAGSPSSAEAARVIFAIDPSTVM